MKNILLRSCLALGLAFAATVAGAHGVNAADGPPETVKPLFKHELPDVPGKALISVEVSFPPGAEAAPHRHPASAFLYAYVLSGEIVSAVDQEQPRVYQSGESWYEAPGAHHRVTRNPSKDTPARLLVVFVADQGERQLVLPDPQEESNHAR